MKTNHTPSARSAGQATGERTIQDYIAILVRGKWIIIIVFAVVMALTVLVTELMEPVYKATAQVLLNTKELQSTLFMDAGARMERGATITQNELTILRSRSLADSVAANLIRKRTLDEEGKHMIPVIQPVKERAGRDLVAPLYVVSGRLSSAIDFDPVRDSDVITITAKSKDPVEAALIANAFAEAYRDRNIYMSRAKTRSFREFLEEQAKEKRKALEENEKSLQTYMERQGIVSLDDEAKKVIDQLSQLEATRDATDISLKQLEKTLESYTEQLPQQETNAARVIGEANDPYIRQMQEQLAKLEVQRDVTVVQNPSTVGKEIIGEKLKEIDTQINALRRKLQNRTDEFLQTLTPSQSDAAGYLKSVKQKIVETEIEVQALKEKKKALDGVIQTYETQFEKIPSKSVAIARLQRARLSNEKLYLMVEEKYNEANITEQSNVGYVEIIEPAAIPFSPASPKVMINLALGLVFGLGLGIAIAFFKEYLDVRIQSPEELKRRGFVPLGAIVGMDPELSNLGSGNGTSSDKRVDPHLITYSYPFSSIAEAYRQVRTNLQFSRLDHSVRSLLVTSPAPGEGKSTTVCNLAIAFAQTGKKVLLIDADLRRPRIEAELNLKRGHGLTGLLNGKASMNDVVQRTVVENLYAITSGAIPPNPAELLGSEKMREFVQNARREYEMVLFDSSPMLAVTDPSVVSTFCDGVILVVAAGKTRVDELTQSAELLERVAGKILGVVINNFDPQRAYGIAYRGARMGSYYGYTSQYASSGTNGSAGSDRQKQQQRV
jgi:capsular exopolysaccharide synthesis family protein